MTAPTIHVTRGKTWENWHESVRQKVVELVDVWNAQPNVTSLESYNAATADLQRLVQQAFDQAVGIRALGGGWSFTPIAATNGILVNTKPLNYQFRLQPANLHANYQARAANLVFAQCGVSISELNTRLFARGKSIRTSGASNGQTIAGAISTGTHGSAIDVGAIQDSVIALHIVTAPDRHVWLERATDPVVADSLVSGLGAELVRDDALFDAALVSLGSFGIIHGVVLEVDDLFYLQEYRRQVDDTPATRAAVDQLDFTQLALGRSAGVRPYFFQALFNPYQPSGKPHLTVMYRETDRPSNGHAPNRDNKWRPGDSAAELLAGATDLVSSLTPGLVGALLKQSYPDMDGVCGSWGEMFWDTSTRGKLASSAMGIPLDRARDALTELYRLNESHQIAGLFAVRYVKASRATLAFTRHQDRTCVLEIDGVYSKRMMDFYQAAWARLDELGIPLTFHWGKMLPFDPAVFVKGYGAAPLDAWRAARNQLLPTSALREVFTNQMLKDLELVD